MQRNILPSKLSVLLTFSLPSRPRILESQDSPKALLKLKWEIFLPFYILRILNSLPFYIRDSWKRYPFSAEPPGIGGSTPPGSNTNNGNAPTLTLCLPIFFAFKQKIHFPLQLDTTHLFFLERNLEIKMEERVLKSLTICNIIQNSHFSGISKGNWTVRDNLTFVNEQ